MITVDIAADLSAEDQAGYVWTFLDEARDPSLITGYWQATLPSSGHMGTP